MTPTNSRMAFLSERYQPILKARKKELKARITSIERDLQGAYLAESGDRGSILDSDEVLREQCESGRETLTAVNAAIERLKANTFGLCASCGEPISAERLEAVPQTPFCRACAEATAGGGGLRRD